MILGVSLKTYFGHAEARRWFAAIARDPRNHPTVISRRVDLVVIPTYLQIAAALEILGGTAVSVGAQDVAATEPGAWTGEVTAAELAEDAADCDGAAPYVVAQLERALADAPSGRVVVAYEPVWAIGAARPASVDHIAPPARALHQALDRDPQRRGSAVVYGGSAGPGLLSLLGDAVDGLFLGRSAHDPANVIRVLDEM